MKVAQLLPDDKFSDAAYQTFERASPGVCTYYSPAKRKGQKPTYIKTFTPKRISYFDILSGTIIKKLLSYDLIIVHALSPFNIQILSKIFNYKNRPPVVWIGMGYDYYDLIYDKASDQYLSDTSLLATDLEKKTETSPKQKLLQQTEKLIKKIALKPKSKKEVLNCIDYFSPVLPSEYTKVKDKYNIPAKYIRWNYGMNSRFYEDLNGDRLDQSKNNILLGNSATLTNNHIEALKLLSNIDFDIEKIVCPLSYGDNTYKAYIANYGNQLFDNKFQPLTEFVSLDKYLKIIHDCPIVIMNHIRQQAGGNISSMLYKGATIFLNRENPFYNFYHDQGVTIFTVDELEENPELINYRLDDDEILHARKVLKSNFGLQASITNTKNLLSLTKNQTNDK